MTLSPYNSDALTYKRFTYATGQNEEIQTSGNFVHNVKTEPIIDDCYPSNGNHTAPAHYWFIKGEIYVYEQTISAYTGSATAYAESVRIPLNITAASNGRLKLLNVQPNLYAYYATDDQRSVIDGEMKLNGVTYHLNDTITYWDYSLLSDANKQRFVPETWVCIKDGTVNGISYTKGQVLLPLTTTPTAVYDTDGNACELSDILRASNNLSHENGYLLTFDMNNPMPWNDWYSPIQRADGSKIDTRTWEAMTDSEKGTYIEGPTFSLNAYNVYGQRDYKVGDIIPADVVANYQAIPTSYMPTTQQATVVPAYVATEELDYTIDGRAYHAEKGADISERDYNKLDATTKAKFTEAFVCTSTITIDEATNNFVINGTLLSQSEIESYKTAYKALHNDMTDDAVNTLFAEHIVKAYRCTAAGKYGGRYYEEPKNYSAIESWCSLPDREGFTFNKDAFDILFDGNFGSNYQADINTYGTPYSEVMPVDYTARYTGASDAIPHNGVTLTYDKEYSREDYEKLPNERYHYSPITAAKNSGTKDYYVVTQSFYSGDMAYIAGQVLTEEVYTRMKAQHEKEMTTIQLTNNTDVDVTYYYCREDYVIGEKGDGNALDTGEATYDVGSTVPMGTVINASTYEGIVNYQQHFVIHGTEPTETSTLYVSRESDIKSLSKDRTFTVMYQYTYDEGDDTGSHIDQISELHVINIHVKFRSGIPTIGDLSAPPTILPGTTVGLTKPSVTEGAYEIMEGGWELYRNSDDAGLHRNGKPFVPSETPLYWYQSDKYQVAYYAKTYLGKTYSNHVPLSVANYHDLSEVMSEKDHHMYVDHPDVIRDSKIYLNAEKHKGENQLTLFSDFFHLTKGEALAGHQPLNTHVKDCENLDFFLQSNLTALAAWSSLGEEGHCFSGTLHGNGYTIDGLDNSLFGRLCGSVYNLGVTGSFTSAGIADTGDGYVENCWINTTGTPDGSVRAVFGNPSRSTGTQIVNSYYPTTKNYNKSDNGRGLATPMSEQAFYNGEVTYDLNGFYLKDRYDRNSSTSPYSDTYVTDRFMDGDFIYADGTIPVKNDIRLRMETDGQGTAVKRYYPIWPDDYLYFGQMLTYGHSATRAHEPLPTHINKVVVDDDGASHAPYYRLPTTEQSNRVYRAPAYYRSKEMGVAHFNPMASLAATSKDGLHEAYPNMTAIDFSGYNDAYNKENPYQRGLDEASGHFFAPLLDDDGLVGIRNYNLTKNLMVYAPASDGSDAPSGSPTGKTRTALAAYFTEPAYTEGDYRTVAINTTSVNGHLVERLSPTSTAYVARDDHMLVRKQDFNVPISYTFTKDNRAWYQRVPDRYALIDKGWEGISLPFEVELVTTQQKGEITHMYQGNTSGHEYWLREFTGISASADAEGQRMAAFTYPQSESDNDKEFNNTFLWDYYYSQSNSLDANADTYYRYYYKGKHTYEGYPHQKAATPYIIGFPGSEYAEFDLSGTWKPSNTYGYISQLDRQTITLASKPGGTIGVSDDEMAGVTHDGYTFRPNYLNVTLAPGTDAYVLNDEGSAYELIPSTGSGVSIPPFRPYFVAAASQARATRSISFGNENSQLFGDEPEPEETTDGKLSIRAGRHKLVVSSMLEQSVPVTIVNTAGITLDHYTIEPGETRETPVAVSGIYIVNNRKLHVK